MAPTLLKAGLFAAFCGDVASSSTLLSFESFIQTYGRSYKQGSAEYESRFGLYAQRLNDYAVHNANPDRLWTAGVNKLCDWTEAELQTLRGWDGRARPGAASRGTGSIQQHHALLQTADSEMDDLPAEKSWSHLSMASKPKEQGSCGSCWAVAVATVLEGHAEINGNPRTFSAQQIVMCTPNPRHCGGEGGCQGATAELGMDWVFKNGAADESTVPYTAKDGQCNAGTSGGGTSLLSTLSGFLSLKRGHKNKGAASFGMTGWETLSKNEYAPLVRAVAERGPVAVSVGADKWFGYQKGIFNGCPKDCIIDHAVTALGYGEHNGHKYWLIQNSWGPNWGESGHIRLLRHTDGDGYCGMDNDPQKGVACEGETAPVPVCGMCGVLFDSVVPHFV